MEVRNALLIGAGLFIAHLALKQLRKKQPTIYYKEKLPFNYNALTVPPFGIYIKQEHEGNSALFQHELIHWRQYQRMGLVPYYFNYAVGMASGYDNHPMEKEARANESEYCQNNYTECVRNGTANTVHNSTFRV